MKGLFTGFRSVVCAMVLSGFFAVGAAAQVSSPIKISLVTDKVIYNPGEPIRMQVKVTNTTTGDVIAAKVLRRDETVFIPFMEQDFHLLVKLTDPNGKTVRTRFQGGGAEPGSGARFQGKPAVPVNVIEPGQDAIRLMDDATFYYEIAGKFGLWKAQLQTSLESFSQYVEDSLTGERYSFRSDPGRQVFDPLVSNTISFRLVNPTPLGSGQIDIFADKLKTGSGSTPGVKKTPLKDIPVHLIRRADVPADLQPINFKTYEQILNTVDPVASALTDINGKAQFLNVVQDDYVVIGLYKGSPDFRHMGRKIEGADPDWPNLKVHLKVLEKWNGKKAAGLTRRIKGSELLITEPEFVQWDSSEELYPFVFESIGDWSVTTSVTPPEGFVADNNSLSTLVDNELEALQFTITDVGSRWEETEVTYRVRHRGRSEVIKSKIGVKLSQRLAELKGLGLYGHSETPRPFTVGGASGQKAGGKSGGQKNPGNR